MTKINDFGSMEYRELQTPFSTDAKEKRFDTEFYVEGYAATFNSPYLLFEYGGYKYYEEIDRNALNNADMTDVIMQYNHTGRVYARKTNNTLIIEPDNSGLFVCADLSKTERAKDLYYDIAAEMTTKMSWAFIVKKHSVEENREEKTFKRRILEVKKVYDVSAVSIPANNDTSINARNSNLGFGDLIKEELRKNVMMQLIKMKAKN